MQPELDDGSVARRVARRPRLRTGQFVRVIWLDIVTFAGWGEENAEKPHPCETYGFITRLTKDALTISSTRSVHEGDTQYNQHIIIPRKVIKSVEEIAI